ncbi:hypothetical protein [Scytonema sp. PCC 10023]|uniref:hypothetical protein n=1 Tax=Scytonema sp. PCC 10023 TaxID=1680591 RepID=UPI0039C63D6C
MTEYINTGLLTGKPESPTSAWILEEKPRERTGQAETSATETSSNPNQANEQ